MSNVELYRGMEQIDARIGKVRAKNFWYPGDVSEEDVTLGGGSVLPRESYCEGV